MLSQEPCGAEFGRSHVITALLQLAEWLIMIVDSLNTCQAYSAVPHSQSSLQCLGQHQGVHLYTAPHSSLIRACTTLPESFLAANILCTGMFTRCC